MSTLTERLLSTPTVDDPQVRRQAAPPGWVVGYEWDGTKGEIRTGGLTDRPKTWDDFIRDAGLNPDEVTVIEPVGVKGWDANMGRDPETGEVAVKRLRWYSLRVIRRVDHADIGELVKLVRRRKAPATLPTGPTAFVIALGDLQLGKMDGDGTEGTVQRYMDGIDAATARLKVLRQGRKIGHIHLAYLGDCIEGFVSQGGANTWRTTLTLTEQIRLMRRLILHAVQTIAPLAAKVTVVSIPGNHDEATRPTTRYDDSFAIEALVQVADALAINPKAYGHVQFIVPGRDELVSTVEIAGTVISHAHGHKWRNGKHFDWWKGQTFGEHAPAAADMLLSGHLHHLLVDTSGRRTFLQVPALEEESTWWRHKTGEVGAPGMATFLVRDGSWSDLAVV